MLVRSMAATGVSLSVELGATGLILGRNVWQREQAG